MWAEDELVARSCKREAPLGVLGERLQVRACFLYFAWGRDEQEPGPPLALKTGELVTVVAPLSGVDRLFGRQWVLVRSEATGEVGSFILEHTERPKSVSVRVVPWGMAGRTCKPAVRLQLRSDDTVRTLRTAIHSRCGVQPELQRLLLPSGTELREDGHNLLAAGIEGDSVTVRLVAVPAVRTLVQIVEELHVSRRDSTTTFKKGQVFETVCKDWVQHDGWVLGRDTTSADAAVCRLLRFPLRIAKPVTEVVVRVALAASGRELPAVSVLTCDNVFAVKRAIQAAHGHPAGRQRLLLDDRPLDNGKPILDLGLGEESVLQLVLLPAMSLSQERRDAMDRWLAGTVEWD